MLKYQSDIESAGDGRMIYASIRRGELYIHGEVNEVMANHISHAANVFLEQKTKSVTVYINTMGGLVFCMHTILSMLELLKSRGVKVETVALGAAASAGAVIFLAGQRRWISPYTFLMYHDTSLSSDGEKASELKRYIKFLESLDRSVMSVLLKDTKMTYKQFVDLMGEKEWMITPKDALEYKFAHGYYVKEERKRYGNRARRKQAAERIPGEGGDNERTEERGGATER